MADHRREHLVDIEGMLRAHERGDVAVVDARQRVGVDASDPEGFDEAHLLGSHFADLDADLAGVSDGTNGRRPLPSADVWEKTVRRWGIERDTPVVVVGAARTPAPARAWWLLRWAGVASVRLLDGGIEAWIAAGGPVTGGSAPATNVRESDAVESDFRIRPGSLPSISWSEVPDFARRRLLLDARPAAKFSDPIADDAGHIPGARSAPAAELFGADGRLLPDGELREHFARLGVDADSEPAAYCGSGVAAALEVLALATLGVRARLYVGSVSEWTADPTRALER